MSAATDTGEIVVSPLEEKDLDEADRVFRVAFGTALGLPDPARFAEGAELVRTRFLAGPGSSFKAESGGELIGCAFLTCWGRYAIFGPLAVRPDHWNRGVGRLLWEARLPLLDTRGITHASLFTRPEPKNVHLYRSFGFWPGFLTALTAKQLGSPTGRGTGWTTYSQRTGGERDAALAQCRALTDAIHPGLDLAREIGALDEIGRGATLLLHDGGELAGLAVCHAGAGSEGGPGSVYVKFAAAASGKGAHGRLGRVLDACEEYGTGLGCTRIVAGVNTARRDAYATVLDRGYAPFAFGVAMHRPDQPAYDRPEAFLLDDRR